VPVVMHISDLHRSLEEPITNPELLAALERDIARHHSENPPIGYPEALIVSGDIVRGAPLGEIRAEAIIKEQYERAEEFLAGLTDLIFDGDRGRVVVCPGNHDVDWNLSLRAMRRIDRDRYPEDVMRALSAPGSNLRWSWSECALYEIADEPLYASRMDQYWEFLHRFYEGFGVLQLPADSHEPLLVELFDKRVLVAAFNSCVNNDCFQRRGEIHPEAVSQLHLDLVDRSWAYELKIAIWHHNTAGPPNADDYLNVEQIRSLVDFGFRLGLHGHQHRSEVTFHELHLPERQSMAVLSAGSLAAGQPELPRGANRQYSLLELRDDLLGARVHLREVESGAQFVARRLNAFGGRSYHDIRWTPTESPVGTLVRTERLNLQSLVTDAERSFKDEDYNATVQSLAAHVEVLPSYGRALLFEAADGDNQHRVILDQLGPSRTMDELAIRSKAAVRVKEFDLARQIVHEEGAALDLPSPRKEELLDWIAAEEATQ
jgi:hypothetical protein